MADDIPDTVPDNFILLDFGDGEYEFRLPVAQIAELQTKCDAGIGAIFSRLMAGRYLGPGGAIVLQPLEARFRYEDIGEIVRLGLIGGGRGTVDGREVLIDPVKARKLVETYIHTRPAMEGWRIAAAVLSAFILGYINPKPQKKSQPETTAKAEGEEPRDGSTSQPV